MIFIHRIVVVQVKRWYQTLQPCDLASAGAAALNHG
jgi:hypothetical protein